MAAPVTFDDTLIEDTFLETDGVRLHAILAGPQDGRLIILLHGFPEFWYGWRKQIQPLATAGFRVLVPDQRGYNLSDKPQDLEDYRLDVLAQDVLGLIEALGRDKASIVGHDWGGVVAWWLALHHPERLERMVILNAPHPAAYENTLLSSPVQILRSSYALFFQIPRLPEAILRNNDWEILVKSLQKSSRPGTFSDEDIEEYRRAWWREGAMTSMLNWYRANLQMPPQIPQEVSVQVPTLLIWGAHDPALGRELARPSIDLCEEGLLVVFETATHWVQHEEAEEVNRLLVGFLSETS